MRWSCLAVLLVLLLRTGAAGGTDMNPGTEENVPATTVCEQGGGGLICTELEDPQIASKWAPLVAQRNRATAELIVGYCMIAPASLSILFGNLFYSGPGFEMALSLFVIGALHAIVSLPLIIVGHVRYSRYRRLVKQSAHQSIIPYIAPTPGGAMAGIGGTF